MTDAQIFDRGYRTYDGPRTGLKGASRSLIVASLRSSLGLGRKARHKIVPLLTILISYVPAIVMVGVVSLFGVTLSEEGSAYYTYYDSSIFIAVVLMVSFMVPQLLCTDRRTGLLGVYLASPLNRPTYLASKAVAALILMLTVTLGPVLFLLISYTLQGTGPDGFGNWLETLSKVILSSLILGGVLTSVALAIASTTDRWATAMASTIGLLLGSSVVANSVVSNADLSPVIRLFSIIELPTNLIHRLFGNDDFWSSGDNPTWTLVLACLVWTGSSLAFVWFRYRKLLVRR